jgi:hypothetical protein
MKEVDQQLIELLKNKSKPNEYIDKIEAFKSLKKLFEFCH